MDVYVKTNSFVAKFSLVIPLLANSKPIQTLGKSIRKVHCGVTLGKGTVNGCAQTLLQVER